MIIHLGKGADCMLDRAAELESYYACISDLMGHPAVRSMDQYIHHSQITCLDHCLSVSYHCFLASCRLGLNGRTAARAGLLHDFYLYDWHLSHPVPGWHGLTHPDTSLRNARDYFLISAVEADCIVKHMWPLTWRFPAHRESWLLCLVDKYCSIVEIFRLSTWQRLKSLIALPNEKF